MISDPKGTMTWYYESSDLDQPPSMSVVSILLTPQFSSMVDRYQDDGFGNAIDTNHLLDTETTFTHILEDLH